MGILQAGVLRDAGFLHAFPTRDTSDAALHASVAAARIVQVKQVHGARAVEASCASVQEADAVVGRAVRVGMHACVASGRGAERRATPGDRVTEVVGVRVADCVPVLVADPRSGDVVAIHAGWRGVVAGVLRAGVDLLFSGRAPDEGREHAVAAIGPCIGPCCFEVGLDVAQALGFVVREAGDRAFVDLRCAVRAQLRALGLVDRLIEDVAGCTKHEPERFHSFRRDGAGSGRMLAAIAAQR